MLKNLEIAAPCTVRWDEMSGDERVRMCGLCHLKVHNISGMTEQQAQKLLQSSADNICVVFYRRADGTILTENCPVGLRKLRDAAKRAGKIVATFLSVMLSIAAAKASEPARHFIRGRCVINARPHRGNGTAETTNLPKENMLPGQMLPRLEASENERAKSLDKATARYEQSLRTFGEKDPRALQALQGSAYYLAYANKYEEAAKQYEKLIELYDDTTPKNVRIVTYQRYRSLLIMLRRDSEIPAVDATLLRLDGTTSSDQGEPGA